MEVRGRRGSPTQNDALLAGRIVAAGRQLGFDLVGICSARPLATANDYKSWLEHGYHGQTAYLARPDATSKRADPSCILPDIRSLIVVGVNYYTPGLPPHLRDDPSRGIVASYARGSDYHDVLTPRLGQLAAFVEAETGQPLVHRAYVDTGPILEREWAVRAGLGFVGRNTNLIHPRFGSWILLGELLLTLQLPPTVPQLVRPPSRRPGTCGRCTRCLDACPTSAFVSPYVLDARRCISYLTIELKGPIPRELRHKMGNRIFGCDVCQDVCPWNLRFATPTLEPAFQPHPRAVAPDLLGLMGLDDADFRQRFQASPVLRARRRGLLRNVAVALGNWADPAAVPALSHALYDAEPLIRGHAAWALGRISAARGREAVRTALMTESDGWVREELTASLEAIACS
jgi:epoxyqueuosine reductase